MVLQYVDLDKIPEKYKLKIKQSLEHFYETITKDYSDIENLRVHFSVHDKNENGKHKYSVRLFVDYPGKPIVVDNAVDWDPVIALSKAIEVLEFKLNKEKTKLEVKNLSFLV